MLDKTLYWGTVPGPAAVRVPARPANFAQWFGSACAAAAVLCLADAVAFIDFTQSCMVFLLFQPGP